MNSITIILSTPFLIGGLIASILNALLPRDPEDMPEEIEDEDVERVGGSNKISSSDDDTKEA